MWTAASSRCRRRSNSAQQNREHDIDLIAVGQEVRWIASMILEQVVKDLADHRPHIRLWAHEFILSPDFEYWADMIDLDIQAARDALKGRLEKAVRGLK